MNVQIEQMASIRSQPIRVIKVGPVEVYVTAAGGRYPEGNFAVVRGKDSAASLDMPLGCHDLPPEALGRDLVLLSHVHEDHTAGLKLLPETPVHVHQADAWALRSIDGLAQHYGYRPEITAAACQRAIEQFHFVERPDAVAFEDGSTWNLGGGVKVRALHAPGHTSGHTLLIIESHGIAFIGDIDLTGFGPYYGDATSNLSAFRNSLALVRDLDVGCWITSHHRGVITNRSAFLAHLDKFEGALDQREDTLMAALKQKPRTLDELVVERFAYPKHFNDLYVDDAERRMISQHLEILQAQGRLSQVGPDWTVTH